MLCVADVGNTNTVLGIYDGETLRSSWRLRTNREMTTDEWGLTVKSLFELEDISFTDIQALIISSVVPAAGQAIRIMGQRYFKIKPIMIEPGTKSGLKINYDNPREVGADRVVNAVAAFEKVKGACIVVDFGTATTFDCISDTGEYLGGVIVPGLRVSLDALVTRAAKLPRIEIATPKHIIGRNTVESMQSGILYGYVALVDGLVDRLKTEMNVPVVVLATGGLAEIIAQESKEIETVDQNLTLEGLRLIYTRNLK